MEALPGYREASEQLGILHTLADHRQDLVDPVLGRGQASDGLGRDAEGLEERTSGGAGRALAANVLWLDANPDAKSDLAKARPGAVSAHATAWSQIIVCLAAAVLPSVKLRQGRAQRDRWQMRRLVKYNCAGEHRSGKEGGALGGG